MLRIPPAPRDRRVRRIPRLSAALVLAATWPAAVCAHEHSLSPSTYVAVRGRPVAISAQVGEGLCATRRTYDAQRTVRFTLRAAHTLDVSAAAAEGDTVWARFAASDRRGAMVAWESSFARHRMEAAVFDAYLESDGLDGPRAARRAARDTSAGRERYRRCSKLWLTGEAPANGERHGDDTWESRERATAPVGLPLEIVPLDAPGAHRDLAVRVLFHGQPLGGALVQVWHAPFEVGASRGANDEERPAPPVWRGRTDARGMVRLRCADAGAWLIGTVHMTPSRLDDESDWESTWASLAFGRE